MELDGDLTDSLHGIRGLRTCTLELSILTGGRRGEQGAVEIIGEACGIYHGKSNSEVKECCT